MDGFYNVNKASDMTSSDVVVKLRGILRSRTGVRYKVGHLGTLDPAATGVLPVAVGQATKLFDYFLDKTKTYIATFRWGVSTDTLDATGRETATGREVTDADEVRATAARFVGNYPQVPPQYSAKSVGGVRAYDLARRGVEVALSPKTVTVYAIDLQRQEGALSTLEITCSAGTYIRSICRDMAEAMGTVGYMQSLTRTRSGEFTLPKACPLSAIEADVQAGFTSLADYAAGLPAVEVASEMRPAVDNGVRLPMPRGEGLSCLYIDGKPIAIVTTHEGYLKVICRL